MHKRNYLQCRVVVLSITYPQINILTCEINRIVFNPDIEGNMREKFQKLGQFRSEPQLGE